MSYSSLADCAADLEKNGRLIRIRTEVDPDQEIAEIHRRIFDQQGPAILFERVKGSPFRALSNLYGTYERTEWLFRHSLERVKKVIELKADPTRALQNPARYWQAPFTALWGLPRAQRLRAPILHGTTTIDQLPLIKSWPMDGGAFVTMPQVFSMSPGSRKIMQSNVGMYRIQLTGNDYLPNREIGLHYQLHRGIGVHHQQYLNSEESFRVSIFVGGPPSHAFSAIMPLPEGLSELTFAGLLGGRRFRYVPHNGYMLSGDADFVITGIVHKSMQKREGPFGDHLGYYSLEHDFPVMEVEQVYHRRNPIWHFSVVGRPPQEDSSFGHLIHLLVKELTTQEFPGVREIHAVDAAGVHPLLLAIGSERYMPFRERQQPEEIITQGTRILGSGQTSLAKFLWIASSNDTPQLTTRNLPAFFTHMLERVDWRRDLHFHTQTTIDTLDYSGSGWNSGSKLLIAAAGLPKRTLEARIPDGFSLPEGFGGVRFWVSGVLGVKGPSHKPETGQQDMERLVKHLETLPPMPGIPLIVICDDEEFTAANDNNFVWVTFTRTNPSHDVYGVHATQEYKHWGCRGALVLDARIKQHHAPELVVDDAIRRRVDKRFSKGGDLYGVV